jgi:hypothetical protein
VAGEAQNQSRKWMPRLVPTHVFLFKARHAAADGVLDCSLGFRGSLADTPTRIPAERGTMKLGATFGDCHS